MRKRFATIVLTFLTAVSVPPSPPVQAQRAAEAKVSNPALGAELARQSLTLLRQGEDSYDPPAKARCYNEGLALARRAVEADDSNADAHFALFATMGRAMLADGATPNPLNLLRVNRELERALELNPRHSDAMAAKGGLYRQLPALLGGNLSKAEQCLRQAIDIDPNAVGARIELARTYQDMGQQTKAMDLLQAASVLAERMGKTRQLREARQLLADLQTSQ